MKDQVYNISMILSRLECYMGFLQFTLFFRREREKMRQDFGYSITKRFKDACFIRGNERRP